MLLRIGSTLAATVMLAVMGTALALWGVNILPAEPLRVGFIALVVAVCLIALRSIARDPRVIQRSYTRARAAQAPEPMIVAIPSTAPLGTCWQCGSAVREENMVCWKCGATQPQRRDLLPPIVPGKETDWDRSETVYRVPEPDVLPTGALPIYHAGAPEGWSDGQASDYDAVIAEADRAFPTPLLAPVQSLDDAYGSEEEPGQDWSAEPQEVQQLTSGHFAVVEAQENVDAQAGG